MIELHFAWKAALIGAAFTLLSGSLSMTPLLWNDSTAFIQSAVETVRQGSLVLFSGVNAVYVLLQEVWWAVTVGLWAFTVVTFTPRAFN